MALGRGRGHAPSACGSGRHNSLSVTIVDVAAGVKKWLVDFAERFGRVRRWENVRKCPDVECAVRVVDRVVRVNEK